MKPRWVPKAAVLAIHEWQISEHGGPSGLLDEGGLDSALASPPNHAAYGDLDLFGLAAHYASALVRNHPFRDGNKRVALVVAGVFLEMNGYRLEAPETEAVGAMLALTTRGIDEKGFAAWLRENASKIPRSLKARRRTTPRPQSPKAKRSGRRGR